MRMIMVEPAPRKPDPVLLPEDELNKPVQYPKLWLAILVLTILSILWRWAVYDEAGIAKSYQDDQVFVETLQQKQREIGKAQIEMLRESGAAQGNNKDSK
jgi:hypothetical protein